MRRKLWLLFFGFLFLLTVADLILPVFFRPWRGDNDQWFGIFFLVMLFLCLPGTWAYLSWYGGSTALRTGLRNVFEAVDPENEQVWYVFKRSLKIVSIGAAIALVAVFLIILTNPH